MADYETLHVHLYAGYHDANYVSNFGGDPVTQFNFLNVLQIVYTVLRAWRTIVMTRPLVLRLLLHDHDSRAGCWSMEDRCRKSLINWSYQPKHSPSYYYSSCGEVDMFTVTNVCLVAALHLLPVLARHCLHTQRAERCTRSHAPRGLPSQGGALRFRKERRLVAGTIKSILMLGHRKAIEAFRSTFYPVA